MMAEKPKINLDELWDKLELFSEFIKVMRGEPKIQERIKVLADPDPIESMSRLSPSQIDVVEICSDIDEYFPELSPLKKTCGIMELASISLDGLGREDIVRFEAVENFLSLVSSGKVNFSANQQQLQQEKPQREDETRK